MPVPPEIEAMLWNLRLRRGRHPSGLSKVPCRRFLQDQNGATAVEFAMVATPFFGLLFAVFQTAMVFWSTQVLETAVANASRQLYTEQFKSKYPTLDPNNSTDAATLKKNFKDLLCDQVKGLFNCATMVDIDVQVVSDFGSANFAPPVVNKTYDPSSYKFQMPGRNQIVVVRASMEFPTFATIGNPATSLSSGNQLIMASAAFLTEP